MDVMTPHVTWHTCDVVEQDSRSGKEDAVPRDVFGEKRGMKRARKIDNRSSRPNGRHIVK